MISHGLGLAYEARDRHAHPTENPHKYVDDCCGRRGPNNASSKVSGCHALPRLSPHFVGGKDCFVSHQVNGGRTGPKS